MKGDHYTFFITLLLLVHKHLNGVSHKYFGIEYKWCWRVGAIRWVALLADVFHWPQYHLALAPRRIRRRNTPLTFQLWYDFEVSYA